MAPARHARGGRKPRRSTPARAPEWLRGHHPVLEALRARRRQLHELRVVGGAGEELEPLLEAAAMAGVPVREVARDELPGRADGPGSAQRAALRAGPIPELDLDALLAVGPAPRCLVLLDGVEDPQNLGAIARVAEAAGVAGLVLSDRRSPPLSLAVSRASAGAIEWLPVARVTNLVRALEQLQAAGFWALAADPDAAQTLPELPDRLLAGDVIAVLGAEGRGLRPSIRAAVDHPVRIPMFGRVQSLNVATAAAVLLYEIRRRGSAGGGG